MHMQVRGAQNNEDLRSIFLIPDMEALLLETGYNKPISQLCLEDQENIVSSVTDYHCLIKVKAAMDHFTEGMDSGGVLEHVKRVSHILKPLFCPKPFNMTAGKLLKENRRDNL